MEQAELIQMNIKAHADLQGLSTSTGAEHRSGATEQERLPGHALHSLCHIDGYFTNDIFQQNQT